MTKAVECKNAACAQETNRLRVFNKRLISMVYESLNKNKENQEELKSIIELIGSNPELTELTEFTLDSLVKLNDSISDSIGKTVDFVKQNKMLHQEVQLLRQEIKVLKEESRHDSLTSALTRGAFDKELERFEEEYVLNEINYTALFLDIDYFKKVNDTYGHKGGDKVLKTFGEILIKMVRKTDIVGRYGGEEFVVLLRDENNNGLEGAEVFASRLKELLKKHSIIFEHYRILITFSGGIYQRCKAKNAKDLITTADKLLYRAKNSGRDRIYIGNTTRYI